MHGTVIRSDLAGPGAATMQNFHDGWEWLCSWILTPACDSTAALHFVSVFQRSTAGAAWPKALSPIAPPSRPQTRPRTCILGGIPRIVLSEHDNCQSTPSVSIICNRHLFDRVGEQLLLAFRLAFLERWFVGSRRGGKRHSVSASYQGTPIGG
jgi:hypothetical protein